MAQKVDFHRLKRQWWIRSAAFAKNVAVSINTHVVTIAFWLSLVHVCVNRSPTLSLPAARELKKSAVPFSVCLYGYA